MSEACKDCKHYDGKYCDEDGKIHDRYDSCKDYAEQRMTKNNKTLDFFARQSYNLIRQLIYNLIFRRKKYEKQNFKNNDNSYINNNIIVVNNK